MQRGSFPRKSPLLRNAGRCWHPGSTRMSGGMPGRWGTTTSPQNIHPRDPRGTVSPDRALTANQNQCIMKKTFMQEQQICLKWLERSLQKCHESGGQYRGRSSLSFVGRMLIVRENLECGFPSKWKGMYSPISGYTFSVPEVEERSKTKPLHFSRHQSETAYSAPSPSWMPVTTEQGLLF